MNKEHFESLCLGWLCEYGWNVLCGAEIALDDGVKLSIACNNKKTKNTAGLASC